MRTMEDKLRASEAWWWDEGGLRHEWDGKGQKDEGGRKGDGSGCGRGRHELWRERGKGFKRSVGISRTMINGGEWRWACSDYDTHEADSVPRFGGRRARVTCNVDGRGETGRTRGPQRGRLEQSFDIRSPSIPSALSLRRPLRPTLLVYSIQIVRAPGMRWQK